MARLDSSRQIGLKFISREGWSVTINDPTLEKDQLFQDLPLPRNYPGKFIISAKSSIRGFF
ncbi:MAG: hypothetical protein QGG48_07130 [Desulfatiglandales bacterium]|jgi:hypothetical protein|nr:hypothetical protein [Desulfatiglandales bacterium]